MSAEQDYAQQWYDSLTDKQRADEEAILRVIKQVKDAQDAK